jgi:hypothetical protein
MDGGGDTTVGEGGTHWQEGEARRAKAEKADYNGARIAFQRERGKKRVGRGEARVKLRRIIDATDLHEISD